MEANLPRLAPVTPVRAHPLRGEHVLIGACAIILLAFAFAAGGVIDHYDNVRVPALLGQASSAM